MEKTCYVLLVLLVHVPLIMGLVVSADPQVPAVYVFGDSTADVGNNNYLPGVSNSAKADFPFYGIDFPHSRPTGRFSNGYIGIDFMAIDMGFRRSPPPYLSLTNKSSHRVLQGLGGVNFASAGSGILDTTGPTTISMTKQIELFANLRSGIVARLGAEKTSYLLSKSVFIISSGGNDAFAFFAQNSGAPNATQKQRFYDTMSSKFENHLKALYNLGARKLFIVDVAPIGCCPYARRQHPTGACNDGMNELARGLNSAFKLLLVRLGSTMQGMRYSVGSTHALVSNIIANPAGVGYEEVTSACCGSGRLRAETACTPNATYCAHRNKFLFWDYIHPTQATSQRVALAFYGGSPKFASPINLKQLIQA